MFVDLERTPSDQDEPGPPLPKRDGNSSPTVSLSGRLAKVMPESYLRFCRPCNAIHLYEMPFRLAAVRAGLELQPDTSPPVLQHITGFRKAARFS